MDRERADAPTILVERRTRVDSALCEAMERLVPQLDPAARIPGAAALGRILASAGTTILVARRTAAGEAHAAAIVGMLTLILVEHPTGLRGWIDDVVVDVNARGAGIGEALVREALRLAASGGAAAVELTSRPGRLAANRLYQRIGFRRRETNVYRYALTPHASAPDASAPDASAPDASAPHASAPNANAGDARSPDARS